MRKVSFAYNNLRFITKSILKLPSLDDWLSLAFNHICEIPLMVTDEASNKVRKIDMRGNPISKAAIEDYVRKSATVEMVYYNYQEELPNGIIQNRRDVIAKNDLVA